MKILVLNNSDSYILEMKNKGFRDDVFVQIGNNYYKMFLYDKTRLIQDYDLSVLTMKSYVPEPNMLIVDKLTNDQIIEFIRACYEEDYFEYLKPCKLNSREEIEYIFSSTQLKTFMDNNLRYKVRLNELITIYDDEVEQNY